jgi:hypothetical protein
VLACARVWALLRGHSRTPAKVLVPTLQIASGKLSTDLAAPLPENTEKLQLQYVSRRRLHHEF